MFIHLATLFLMELIEAPVHSVSVYISISWPQVTDIFPNASEMLNDQTNIVLVFSLHCRLVCDSLAEVKNRISC